MHALIPEPALVTVLSPLVKPKVFYNAVICSLITHLAQCFTLSTQVLCSVILSAGEQCLKCCLCCLASTSSPQKLCLHSGDNSVTPAEAEELCRSSLWSSLWPSLPNRCVKIGGQPTGNNRAEVLTNHSLIEGETCRVTEGGQTGRRGSLSMLREGQGVL